MTPALLLYTAIDPALTLLPTDLTDDRARAMLVAIALQESGLKYRRQVRGPARGFWQFEQAGGVEGVMRHDKTGKLAWHTAGLLCYEWNPKGIYYALAHNDILAATFARLLLLTVHAPLPDQGSPDEGWHQYLSSWRPGRPHREAWDRNFTIGWDAVLTAHNESQVS